MARRARRCDLRGPEDAGGVVALAGDLAVVACAGAARERLVKEAVELVVDGRAEEADERHDGLGRCDESEDASYECR